MGRYVRRILTDWREADLDLTLIVRDPEHEAILAQEFPYRVERGVSRSYDAIWYPWNALRFDAGEARKVVTIYDTFAFTYPHRDFVARWREQAPIKRAVRHADALITISHWSAREIGRVFHFDPALLYVVAPVPDAFWRPVATDPTQRYVLVVAGPDERKNIRTLIDACARVCAPSACELVVAGSLSERDDRALITSGLPHRRVRPDDAQLRALYSGAAAVAVPSSAEGYGLMCVEAMACGAPVVAADASALPEACDGAALMVPPFDVGAWADALGRLINEPALREKLRERGYERVAPIDRTQPARATLSILRGDA